MKAKKIPRSIQTTLDNTMLYDDISQIDTTKSGQYKFKDGAKFKGPSGNIKLRSIDIDVCLSGSMTSYNKED